MWFHKKALLTEEWALPVFGQNIHCGQMFTGLTIDVALGKGAAIAAQVAHALPGQEGGAGKEGLQILGGDVELRPYLLPDVLLPCNGLPIRIPDPNSQITLCKVC